MTLSFCDTYGGEAEAFSLIPMSKLRLSSEGT